MLSTFNLFKTRRFTPLFVAQFIGAFGDNIFRSALITYVTFVLSETQGFDPKPVVSLAIGIFMLPYFLFSATAGQLADKRDKAMVMRRLKAIEIGLLTIAGLSLISGQVGLMLLVLFLAGTQSAFYSPLKYALLPQHLTPEELLPGNALIGAGTFLAILLGTLTGALLVMVSTALVAALMVALSIAGYITTLYIPEAPPAVPNQKIYLNPITETWNIIASAFAQKGVPLVILGHAWFWFVGSTYLGQMPTLAKETLNASEGVYTLFFTLFSIGIGLGALLINRALKGEVNGRFLPLATLGMAVIGVELAVSLDSITAPTTTMSLGAFLGHGVSVQILLGFLLLSMSAGAFIVPLNALLQARANPAERARTIAASNITDSAGMVVASLIAATLLGMGLSIPQLWLALAILSFFAVLVISMLIPQDVLKSVFRAILRVLYDVKVEGAENITGAGPKAVIVANHVSLLDGILLGAFLPGRPVFAVNSFIAERWWAKIFLNLVDCYQLDPTKPLALKGLVHAVAEGRHCVIFPEGRITTTGSLMKVNEGPGLIADKAGAPIIPLRIDGAQYTPLSYLKRLRRHLFPRITITVLPPRTFELPNNLPARKRRQIAGRKLYDLMSDLMFETSPTDVTLVEAICAAAALHGDNQMVLEDRKREPIPYSRLKLGMLLLGRRFKAFTQKGERVGILLPNANGTATAFFALQLYGRVPAMLNFTAGIAGLKAAAQAATLKHVLTSREFIEQGKLEDQLAALAETCKITYLEDIRDSLTPTEKIAALASRPFLKVIHRYYGVKADDAAVVLFTSGSEGLPKGVVLSHRNIIANRHQIGARLDFTPEDIVLNALPLFHSFGLTGGLLIPLLSGAKTVLYPSPLHYRIVPLLAYDCNATIMFGTDTFLTGYARTAHPYDFYSLRFICAGAEKVREETRRIYSEKFGVRIFEGYGTTETAPVLAVNTPLYNKPNTVGRLLPGMTAKLEPVPGVAEGGRLKVTGPNVLIGYLFADKPGQLIPPPTDQEGRWHDTGDIVTIDPEGFIAIKGRAKRFAKIAGEMVSLSAVEDFVNKVWPDFAHAVVAVPDPRKGEALVLITTNPAATVEPLQQSLAPYGLTELMLPRRILTQAALPLLGSGKTDYVAAQKLVENAAA